MEESIINSVGTAAPYVYLTPWELDDIIIGERGDAPIGTNRVHYRSLHQVTKGIRERAQSIIFPPGFKTPKTLRGNATYKHRGIKIISARFLRP